MRILLLYLLINLYLIEKNTAHFELFPKKSQFEDSPNKTKCVHQKIQKNVELINATYTNEGVEIHNRYLAASSWSSIRIAVDYSSE